MTEYIHRPELHFAPESGLLEAPAGVLLDGDTWHLFFQYKPTPDAPSRWGHTYSAAMPFDWLECNDALAPVGAETSLRAGAVTAVEGAINLYFTSLTDAGTTVNLARYSTTEDVCEITEDPLELDSHVVRVGPVVGNTENFVRFRTPCVVPDWREEDRDEGHEGFLMLALTGSGESPAPVILTSPDGQSWNFEGPLTFTGADTGFHESASDEMPPVVAPRIIRLRDEVDGRIYDILLVTLEREGTELSGYLVGRLEGTVFDVVTGFQRLDYGHDFTRPRNTNITPGTVPADKRYDEATIFGLLNCHGRKDSVSVHPTLELEGWANALSLPRHLTLQGGKVYQTPARGLPDAVSETTRARLWTGLLEVPGHGDCAVEVKLLDAHGEPAAVITHSGDVLALDRSMGTAFGGRYTGEAPATAPLAEDDSDSLTIVVDGATVEVYADGGQVAMASRVYFEGGCSGIEVTTTGEASIDRDWERHGN